MAMDDKTREQMVEEVRALQAQLKSGAASPSQTDAELHEHLESLHAIVAGKAGDTGLAERAQTLEQRLLAWEAEHPALVAFAARVARAFEDAGL
jgi:hypothetical protein